eukprot:6194461-Pleurochrysis_carterae.AAC.5
MDHNQEGPEMQAWTAHAVSLDIRKVRFEKLTWTQTANIFGEWPTPELDRNCSSKVRQLLLAGIMRLSKRPASSTKPTSSSQFLQKGVLYATSRLAHGKNAHASGLCGSNDNLRELQGPKIGRAGELITYRYILQRIYGPVMTCWAYDGCVVDKLESIRKLVFNQLRRGAPGWHGARRWRWPSEMEPVAPVLRAVRSRPPPAPTKQAHSLLPPRSMNLVCYEQVSGPKSSAAKGRLLWQQQGVGCTGVRCTSWVHELGARVHFVGKSLRTSGVAEADCRLRGAHTPATQRERVAISSTRVA